MAKKLKKTKSQGLVSSRTWSGFIEVEAFEARSKTIRVPLGVRLQPGATAIAALQPTTDATTSYRIVSYRLSTSGSTQNLEIVIAWDGTATQRSYVVYYVTGFVAY